VPTLLKNSPVFLLGEMDCDREVLEVNSEEDRRGGLLVEVVGRCHRAFSVLSDRTLRGRRHRKDVSSLEGSPHLTSCLKRGICLSGAAYEDVVKPISFQLKTK
jgi:hypothetical protein